MKACVFQKIRNFELKEVEVPKINPEEVLIRVGACGICTTDIKIYKGEKTRGVRIPSILGHEISGQVVKVGSKVKEIAENDKVAVAPGIPCGKCHFCLRGTQNLCINRSALGYQHNGGFAEYVKIPANAITSGNVVKFPDSLSYEEASLAEPLACCINGSDKNDIKLGDTVLVIGAGPLGLMHIQVVKMIGAKKVIVSELLENRGKLALRLGADVWLNPKKSDFSNCIRQETNNLGVDTVIVSVNIPEIINVALENTKKGGTVNLFGGFPIRTKANIEPNLVHYNELKIVGTSGYTQADFQTALSLIISKKINVKDIISHTFSLDRIQEAIDMVLQHKGIRVVIKP